MKELLLILGAVGVMIMGWPIMKRVDDFLGHAAVLPEGEGPQKEQNEEGTPRRE